MINQHIEKLLILQDRDQVVRRLKDQLTTIPLGIKVLEDEIDKANKELPILHSFVLPGGSKANAFLHLARTVCRRCERNCCDLYEEEKIDKITGDLKLL